MKLCAAAICWKIRSIDSERAYFNHMEELVRRAADQGAQLAVFPELHVLELLSLFPASHEFDAPHVLAPFADQIEAGWSELSETHGMTIVGGTHFKKTSGGIVNACPIAVPGLPLRMTTKNQLTGYERDSWKLTPGSGELAIEGELGVAICYDSEFPEAARAISEAGVLVLAVPSWTESRHGFQRVRWSCLARSIENQIFVVQSSLVGGIGLEPIPDSQGSAAVISPSAEPFALEEIVVETPLNQEGIAVAELDFHKLDACRAGGEVSNWNHRHATSWKPVSRE